MADANLWQNLDRKQTSRRDVENEEVVDARLYSSPQAVQIQYQALKKPHKTTSRDDSKYYTVGHNWVQNSDRNKRSTWDAENEDDGDEMLDSSSQAVQRQYQKPPHTTARDKSKYYTVGHNWVQNSDRNKRSTWDAENEDDGDEMLDSSSQAVQRQYQKPPHTTARDKSKYYTVGHNWVQNSDRNKRSTWDAENEDDGDEMLDSSSQAVQRQYQKPPHTTARDKSKRDAENEDVVDEMFGSTSQAVQSQYQALKKPLQTTSNDKSASKDDCSKPLQPLRTERDRKGDSHVDDVMDTARRVVQNYFGVGSQASPYNSNWNKNP